MKLRKELLKMMDYRVPKDKQANAYKKYSKQYFIRKAFGYTDKTVNKMLKANTNKEKVKILKEARKNMNDSQWIIFINKGYETKLISDNLIKDYRKSN